MKPELVEKFLITRDKEQLSNEATFIVLVWAVSVGESRTVKLSLPRLRPFERYRNRVICIAQS